MAGNQVLTGGCGRTIPGAHKIGSQTGIVSRSPTRALRVRASLGRVGNGHGRRPDDGTGEIRIESADRAAGYFTTRSDTHPKVHARTSGVYLRADPEDMSILDGGDDRQRAELIAERLRHWKSITNA